MRYFRPRNTCGECGLPFDSHGKGEKLNGGMAYPCPEPVTCSHGFFERHQVKEWNNGFGYLYECPGPAKPVER